MRLTQKLSLGQEGGRPPGSWTKARKLSRNPSHHDERTWVSLNSWRLSLRASTPTMGLAGTHYGSQEKQAHWNQQGRPRPPVESLQFLPVTGPNTVPTCKGGHREGPAPGSHSRAEKGALGTERQDRDSWRHRVGATHICTCTCNHHPPTMKHKTGLNKSKQREVSKVYSETTMEIKPETRNNKFWRKTLNVWKLNHTSK